MTALIHPPGYDGLHQGSELTLQAGQIMGEAQEEEEEEEEAQGYDDDDFLDLLKEMIGKVYDDFEGPIDMHVRTDREDIMIVVCRNDPIRVRFYTINAKQYFDDDREHEECFADYLTDCWINKSFEAEMLSRAFLEHILLNPAFLEHILLNPEHQQNAQPERTEV